MTIEEFLSRCVEGYLFGDLDNMSKLDPPPGSDCGAAGYPMVASTLAGIELLGGLLVPAPRFDVETGGNPFFQHFWDHHLTAIDPRYRGLGPLARALVRNGIAHVFTAKPGIQIVKGAQSLHLQTDTVTYLRLDAVALYGDFRAAYERAVRQNAAVPIVSAIRQLMQSRLDEMLTYYEGQAKKQFAAVTKNAAWAVPATPYAAVAGVSGTSNFSK